MFRQAVERLRIEVKYALYMIEAWLMALAADWPGKCMIYVAGYLLVVALTLLVVWFIGLR
jgi:hypothetical protein